MTKNFKYQILWFKLTGIELPDLYCIYRSFIFCLSFVYKEDFIITFSWQSLSWGMYALQYIITENVHSLPCFNFRTDSS